MERVMTEFVLVFLIVTGNRVWLAKKTKKIGVGLYNGFGGKVEAGETAEQAALREVVEETGGIEPDPEALKFAGTVVFCNDDKPEEPPLQVKLYCLEHFAGWPKPTNEMAEPELFSINQLPLDHMMPADRHWLPLVLGGRQVLGEFHYYDHQTKLKPHFYLEPVCRWKD